MILDKPVSDEYIKNTKEEIFIEKLVENLGYCSRDSGFIHPFVINYYKELEKKFNKFIIAHSKRIRNGFKYLPLAEKIKKINKIRPDIEWIAQLNNPNHPHIGLARELSEEVFYKL